jgi:hypothetical protein
MQIKTTLRFHLTPAKCPPSKTPPPANAGKDVGESNPHTLLVGM